MIHALCGGRWPPAGMPWPPVVRVVGDYVVSSAGAAGPSQALDLGWSTPVLGVVAACGDALALCLAFLGYSCALCGLCFCLAASPLV